MPILSTGPRPPAAVKLPLPAARRARRAQRGAPLGLGLVGLALCIVCQSRSDASFVPSPRSVAQSQHLQHHEQRFGASVTDGAAAATEGGAALGGAPALGKIGAGAALALAGALRMSGSQPTSRSQGVSMASRGGQELTADPEDQLAQLPRWAWQLVILFLCMIWATNFAVIKEITAQPGVTTQLYAVCRFTIAALALAPGLFSISSSKIFMRSIECGSWVAFGYIGQAIGLMTTTAAKSCFICCLNVVFVSLVSGFMKQKFDPRVLGASLLAITGVGFLEFAGSQQFVIGDLISLAQPIGFGMGYIRLEQIMEDSPEDARGVTAAKLLVVCLAAWGYYITTNGALPDIGLVTASGTAVAGLLWTGLITTALSLLVESVAFRYVDATSASVIFTTEPLWAALFAMWLIQEPLSAADGVGGLLVILANVFKEVPLAWLGFEEEKSPVQDVSQMVQEKKREKVDA